jgi:hypothetical protein
VVDKVWDERWMMDKMACALYKERGIQPDATREDEMPSTLSQPFLFCQTSQKAGRYFK